MEKCKDIPHFFLFWGVFYSVRVPSTVQISVFVSFPPLGRIELPLYIQFVYVAGTVLMYSACRRELNSRCLKTIF